jgi:hypothetical protein
LDYVVVETVFALDEINSEGTVLIGVRQAEKANSRAGDEVKVWGKVSAILA